MPDRPLLLFPTPETASRSSLGGGGGWVARPAPQRQWERLSPVFRELQAAFDNQRVDVHPNAAGIVPEQVLVIETVGSVEDFVNAVRRVDGFEWMGEIEIDAIAPDEEFYEEGKPDKELSGRLYWVNSIQQGRNEIYYLLLHYHADAKKQFERGLTKFRDMFLNLKSIRHWGVQDQLIETGVIDSWREDLAHDHSRIVSFEI